MDNRVRLDFSLSEGMMLWAALKVHAELAKAAGMTENQVDQLETLVDKVYRAIDDCEMDVSDEQVMRTMLVEIEGVLKTIKNKLAHAAEDHNPHFPC